MQSIDVRVRWLVKQPPPSGRYVTLCAFPESPFIGGESWSMVLDFPELPSAHREWIEAKASFLSLEAPWEKLQPQSHFEMFEGRLKTAWVEVVEAP